MKNLILISIISCASLAFANDGFYQGAGTSLQPIENKSMRVISEDLNITPLEKVECYKVNVPKSSLDQKGEPIQDAFAELGDGIACPKWKNDYSKFTARYHAKAVYKVSALKDQNNVQIGFPVPQWNYDQTSSEGRVTLRAPGAIHFTTSVNGKSITALENLEVPVGKNGEENIMAPAFVWKTNFKAGQTYELITEYDFGVDYSNNLYPGAQYAKDAILWFDKRSVAEARFGTGMALNSQTIVYYLKPIQLWAGGLPEQIRVRVETPKDIPIYYLTTMNDNIDCVDQQAIYFKWQNAYPNQDLKVSYPVPVAGKQYDYKKIRRDYEFMAWNDMLGVHSTIASEKGVYPKLRKSCDLVHELEKNLPKDSTFKSWQKNGFEPECVQSCQQ